MCRYVVWVEGIDSHLQVILDILYYYLTANHEVARYANAALCSQIDIVWRIDITILYTRVTQHGAVILAVVDRISTSWNANHWIYRFSEESDCGIVATIRCDEVEVKNAIRDIFGDDLYIVFVCINNIEATLLHIVWQTLLGVEIILHYDMNRYIIRVQSIYLDIEFAVRSTYFNSTIYEEVAWNQDVTCSIGLAVEWEGDAIATYTFASQYGTFCFGSVDLVCAYRDNCILVFLTVNEHTNHIGAISSVSQYLEGTRTLVDSDFLGSIAAIYSTLSSIVLQWGLVVAAGSGWIIYDMYRNAVWVDSINSHLELTFYVFNYYCTAHEEVQW